MKKKGLLLLVSLLVLGSLFLAACGVPQEDYAAIQSDLAVANTNLANTQNEITRLEGELADANADIERLTTDLNLEKSRARFDFLVCEDHTWDEIWGNQVGVWLAAPDTFEEIDETMFAVYVTQWTPVGEEWDDALSWTILMSDEDDAPSMILDLRENCVILNPSWFNPNSSGQSD